MSDAACDQNNNLAVATTSSYSLTIIEEHWRKGIILVQIWREVLRVILFAGEPGEGLDEKSKREMWLLLVAAGSGYLARCWHKTLKPKPQLTNHSHEADHDEPDPHNREEDSQRVLDGNNSIDNNLLTSSSSFSSQPLLEGTKENPLDAARIRKLAPRPLRRNFSPKVFGKKLFSSDGSKNVKASKKESALSPLSAATASARRSTDAGDRESDRSASSGEKSLSQDAAASVGERSNSSRRSPWSSFRSHSFSKAQAREGSPGAADDEGDSSGDSSPGCLKRAGDTFRKNRERRKSDNGSLSSRSLQGILGADGGDGGSASAGSSRRELDPADSLYSSSGLTNMSVSSLGVAAALEISEPSGEVGESPEVTSRRNTRVENEAKSSSPDVVSQRSSSTSTIRKEAPSSSVAAVVARIEKGNASAKAETVHAILSLRAANQAHAQGQAIAVTDIVKTQKLKLKILEQNSSEEAEIPPGGKGKRRAGDGEAQTRGGNEEMGMGGGLPAPLSTGKRTKDSKDSNSSDASGVTFSSITGKRMEDASVASKDDVRDFDETSTSVEFAAVDLSQVFFGFDSTFLESPTEEKSPFKFYRRSRQLSRSGRSNMRKMRESPRPVSALESCLRAQFPDRDNEGFRVARSLNFSSSSVTQRCPQRDGESLDSGADVPFSRDVSHSESPRSSSDERGLAGGSQQRSPQRQTEGALGLPLLMTPPSSKGSALRFGVFSERSRNQLDESESKYPRKVVFEDRERVISNQSKLSDVLWRPTTLPVALKKRKLSQACSPSANSTHLQARGYELEALVIPPMEGLLFCFGMGIGVMSLIDGPNDNVERLSRELQKSEEKIENLSTLLVQARESSVVQATALLSKEIIVAGRFSSEEVVTEEVRGKEFPFDQQSVTPAIAETERQFDLYRREAPETPQQTEHMAELEAELEAELDALTSSITDVASGPPDFEELDPEGVAGVADGDLGVEGLPAAVDWDDDNDDFITEEPAHSGGGVPPRELSRLLRKVQNSRQEYRIAELEADLHEALEKLQTMESELHLLREKTIIFALPPSAGTLAESSEPVARGVFERHLQSDNSLWSAKIERLNQNMFEGLETLREETNSNDAGTTDRNSRETNQWSGEQSATSISLRQEHALKVLGSMASEPVSILDGSADSDPAAHLPVRAASESTSRPEGSSEEFGVSGAWEHTSSRQETESGGDGSISRVVAVPASTIGSITRRSVSSMFSSMESINSEAQADNDAVCDEFLSSVFCSPDDSQLGLSSGMSSPLLDQITLSNTPEENSEASVISKDVPLDTGATAVGEDLDQVVGQLLKRDSSSVKNAINAFLRWEAAEKDDAPSKDDMTEEEASTGSYSRRTAGKNPTPQKTPVLSSVSSSVTPQKTSMISARLEQLARSAFTSEKMPYSDKPVGSARRLCFPADEKSPGGVGGKMVDVFQYRQPSLPKLDDRSPKALGLWEYPVTKRDHSSQSLRRGEAPGKGETSMTDTLRDLFRGESPVFGGGDRDFQALLDTRRELRYSSSKVQLSLTGQDTASVFRQRDDSSRAGTNSPIGRPPARNAFQSPKFNHSRMALGNSLYQNPTSDWLAEVGSPPDLDSM